MATLDSTTAWPLIRRIGDAIKRNAWDERSTTERAGVGAAAAMIALFGGTFAVLGTLGTAVGTPLWIVFGSGDGFARVLERSGVAGHEAAEVAAMVSGVADLAAIRAGTPMDVRLGRRASFGPVQDQPES